MMAARAITTIYEERAKRRSIVVMTLAVIMRGAVYSLLVGHEGREGQERVFPAHGGREG